MKIDLHIHTIKSDGVLTPKEIIDEAVKNDVSVISITDHDTLEAYTDDLINYAKEKNIKLIKGVEISSKTEKSGIHVLGYNIDINNKKLNDTLYRLRNARHIYLYDVSKKLEELGYKINMKELDKIDAVTKAHIALDVVSNKDNAELLLKVFKHIPSKGEFIETIMNEGCPAYVLKNTITPSDAAKLIKEAGGKVVLAHPVAYRYEDNLNEGNILNIINDINADGIETYYLYVDRNNKRIDEVNFWKNFAIKNNLPMTIGSDFHNKDGIRPDVGFTNWPLILTYEEINNVLNFLGDLS